MSKQEDISVRIVADYQKALKDMQMFIGAAGKEFQALPKIVQQVGTSIDALDAKIGRLGQSQGPEILHRELAQLPSVVMRLAQSVDGLNERVDKLGNGQALPNLNRRLNEADQHATKLAKTFDLIHKTANGIGSAVASYQAAKMVVAPKVHETMDYGMRMAYAINTADMGQSIAQKQADMRALDAGVMNAVRFGGKSRDEVLEGAESLIARGIFGNLTDTLKVLPYITQTATAGNAQVKDVGQIAGAARLSLNIPTEKVGDALGMALYGGSIGGFEMRDMARYLPRQSASAKNAGLSGLSGMAKLVALNELAINSAGSPEEAGINVGDFLTSLSSAHLATNLQRFAVDKKRGTLVPKVGRGQLGGDYLDLGHQLAENQAHGMDAIDTMIGIVHMVTAGDQKFVEAEKNFQQAKQRLESAKKNGDKAEQVSAAARMQEISESVYQILMGRGIGKLFHNQQEMRGGIGAFLDPAGYHRMVQETQAHGNKALTANDAEFIASQPGYKLQMKQEEEANALYHGLQGANGALGKYSDAMTELYRKYPGFASAVEDATLAVKGLTAGLAGLGIFSLLTKYGAGAAAAGSVATAAGAAEGGGAAVGALATAGAAAGYAAPVALPLMAAWGFHEWQQSGAGQQSRARGLSLENSQLQRRINIAKANGDMDLAAKLERQRDSQQSIIDSTPGAASATDPDPGRVTKALHDTVKMNPIEAKLQLQIAFDEMGKPVVTGSKMSGTNFRLDTGPMMTH